MDTEHTASHDDEVLVRMVRISHRADALPLSEGTHLPLCPSVCLRGVSPTWAGA